MKKIFELWWTFFKIGAFTFGGGYAMISLIQKETVENKKWITDDDILEIIAIAAAVVFNALFLNIICIPSNYFLLFIYIDFFLFKKYYLLYDIDFHLLVYYT